LVGQSILARWGSQEPRKRWELYPGGLITNFVPGTELNSGATRRAEVQTEFGENPNPENPPLATSRFASLVVLTSRLGAAWKSRHSEHESEYVELVYFRDEGGGGQLLRLQPARGFRIWVKHPWEEGWESVLFPMYGVATAG